RDNASLRPFANGKRVLRTQLPPEVRAWLRNLDRLGGASWPRWLAHAERVPTPCGPATPVRATLTMAAWWNAPRADRRTPRSTCKETTSPNPVHPRPERSRLLMLR